MLNQTCIHKSCSGDNGLWLKYLHKCWAAFALLWPDFIAAVPRVKFILREIRSHELRLRVDGVPAGDCLL